MASSASESLLLHFEEKPRAIVAAMDNLRNRGIETRKALEGTWKVPVGLIATGIALFAVDRSSGYQSHLFAFPAVGLVLVGLWTLFRLRGAGRQPRYRHPGFDAARYVIHTLRDDLAPKRNLHGTLDLTGTEVASKKSRDKRDARGRNVSYYRDDWLTLKAKLYDGSMLRVAVVRRLKIRDSYTKRGRVSGKLKRKPAVVKADFQQVNIRVSANPALYRVTKDMAPSIGQMVGKSRIDAVDVDGGLLRVTASCPRQPPADEILDLLLRTYATLQRKALA